MLTLFSTPLAQILNNQKQNPQIERDAQFSKISIVKNKPLKMEEIYKREERERERKNFKILNKISMQG